MRSGILPAMKITDPYSPTARAKDRAKPVSAAGISIGRMIRRIVPAACTEGGRGFFDLAIHRFENWLHSSDDEGQADKHQRQKNP